MALESMAGRFRWSSLRALISRWAICGGALSLCACGGGGSDSSLGATVPPSQSQPPSQTSVNSTAAISASPNSIATIAATNQGAPLLESPVTIYVPTQGTYYFELSYAGTAISAGSSIGLELGSGASGVFINGENSIEYNTTNSTLGSTPALGNAIGETIYGSWSASTLAISSIVMIDPAILGAGIYHDQITVLICQDAACTEPIGSPLTIPVTYDVTGNPIPSAAQITVYPDVQVEVPSSQTTAATASITIDASSLPPTGAYVIAGASATGLVTGTSFTSTLGPNGGGTVQGTVAISLPPPSTVGAGIHTDTFPLNVCFDEGCTKPAAGSPWTAQVTYIVDPVAGSDYTQQTIGVAVAGMVWDSETNKLYAIIPGYSAVDPNTLAQIDPYTASIDTAVTLDGGVGNIEPGTLAVSGDGQYLYIAVSDASGTTDHVERLLTSDLGLDLSIPLPTSGLVAALQPAPGAPHTLAVETSGESPELLIFDDATPRSDTLTGQNGTTLMSFTWGSDATTIYAGLRGTAGTLDALSVTAAGVQVSQSLTSQSLLTAVTLSNPMQFVNGLVYWDSGAVFDPVAFALTTSFDVDTNPVASAAFDTGLNRAYFVTADQPSGSTSAVTTIEAFNLTTLNPLWLVRFPSQNPATDLTRWGSNGLAFAENTGGTNSLVLISGPIVTQ